MMFGAILDFSESIILLDFTTLKMDILGTESMKKETFDKILEQMKFIFLK